MLTATSPLSTPALAQTLPTVEKMKTPDWVTEQKIPQSLSERVAEGTNGISALLTDRQVHWQDGGFISYFRQVYKVVNRSGLEAASRIVANFDPSVSLLRFHRIRIIRDGKTIDQIKELEIKVLQREAYLENGIWTGAMTAVSELRDVQVGDIIDFELSSSIHNDLTAGMYDDYISALTTAPVAEMHYELIWPRDQPVHVRQIDTDEEIAIRKDGKFIHYTWQAEDPEPYEPEPYTPIWYLGPMIALSTMDSWGEMVEWARPILEVDLTLPDDFAKSVDDISEQWKRPEDQITELLRLVQDTVRYVSILIGPGALVPRTPKRVLELGYGDCKDKTILLVAALRRLGFDAVPALANAYQGKSLQKRLPGLSDFNHAIVNVRLNGRDFWLDPTLSQQGGRFPDIAIPSYEYVLPLWEGQSELVHIISPIHSGPDVKVTRSYNFNADTEPGLSLAMESRFVRGSADTMRALLSQMQRSDLAKGYLNDLTGNLPGLKQKGEIHVEDDRDANVVTTRIEYEDDIKSLTEKGLLTAFSDKAKYVVSILPSDLKDDRKSPINLAVTSTSIEEEVYIRYDGKMLEPKPDVARAVDSITFERTSETDEDGQGYTTRYLIKVPVADASISQAGEISELADFVDDETSTGFKLRVVNSGLAKRFKVEPEIFSTVAERLAQATELMQQNKSKTDLKDALTLLDDMLKEVPPPSRTAGFLDGMRGQLLIQMGRTDEGREALEKSITHYRDMPEFLFVLSLLRAESGNVPDAAKLMTDYVDRFPDRAYRLNERLVRGLMQAFSSQSEGDRDARFEFARVLTKAGYRQDPLTDLGQELAAETFVGLGERDRGMEAGPLVPLIRDTQLLLTAFVDRRYEAIWPDIEERAGSDFSKALAQDVGRYETNLKDDPEDVQALHDLLEAMWRTGQRDIALERTKSYADKLHDLINVSYMDTPTTRFIVAYLDALNGAGRGKEALAYYETLSGWYDPQGSVPRSIYINYGILLLWNNRYEDAIAQTTPLTQGRFGGVSAPMMWGLAIQVCANNELGNKDEVEKGLNAINSTYFASPEAQSLAFACVGDYEKLGHVMIRQLEAAGKRSNELLVFQHYQESDQPGDFRQRVRRCFDKARMLPAVQEKLKAVGRVVSVASPFYGWQNY